MTRRAPADVDSILRRHGQEHLLAVFEALDAAKAESFAAEIRAVDFDLLKRLVAEAGRAPVKTETAEPEPPHVVKKGADPAKDAAFARTGAELLKQGKVAALVVAGGQGSRLGHAGPKGTFPATPVKRKTLFRLFAEKIRALDARSGRPLPLLVMTSEENHGDTTAFFEANGRFGLAPDQVSFFMQGMLPAVDVGGALVMRDVGALFRSPNGHGGTLLALHASGTLERLGAIGVEHLFYFQVDNPLVEICDPVFMGGHSESGSDFSSKVVPKSDPEEKVGVVVRRAGGMEVVEYSDLPAELRNARNADGSLKFDAGNIAVHALRLEFVKRLNAEGFSLPYHVARKTLQAVSPDGRAQETKGLKFETFVFDALKFASRPFCLEVAREREFAPIKNASGVDSAASSADLQSRLAAAWLDAAGHPVPRGADGAPMHPVEISPLYADSAEALRAKKPAAPDFSKPVYFGVG